MSRHEGIPKRAKALLQMTVLYKKKKPLAGLG
jgi:hypothetical protein